MDHEDLYAAIVIARDAMNTAGVGLRQALEAVPVAKRQFDEAATRYNTAVIRFEMQVGHKAMMRVVTQMAA